MWGQNIMAKNRRSYRSGCEDEIRLFRGVEPDQRFFTAKEELQRELKLRFDDFQWSDTILSDTFPSDRFFEANAHAYHLLCGIQDKYKYLMTVGQCSDAVVNVYRTRK